MRNLYKFLLVVIILCQASLYPQLEGVTPKIDMKKFKAAIKASKTKSIKQEDMGPYLSCPPGYWLEEYFDGGWNCLYYVKGL
jgi:hypothetical protein